MVLSMINDLRLSGKGLEVYFSKQKMNDLHKDYAKVRYF